MNRRKGFTLIELLVVIAVIVLLLSILTPSLKSAKRLATSAVCLSNQRGLIVSWYMYADDNNSDIADADTSAGGEDRWAFPPITEEGSILGSPGADVTLEDRFRGIEAGVLFDYNKNVKLYHCPNDNRIKLGTYLGSSLAYKMYRSYGIQGGLHGEEMRRSSEGLCVTKISQVKQPDKAYVFVEEYYDGWYANFNGGSWQIDVDNNGQSWWNIMAIWHNDSSTLSFADSHVERIKWRDPRTREFAESRRDGEATQPDNPDLEFMIDNYAVPLPRQ